MSKFSPYKIHLLPVLVMVLLAAVSCQKEDEDLEWLLSNEWQIVDITGPDQGSVADIGVIMQFCSDGRIACTGRRDERYEKSFSLDWPNHVIMLGTTPADVIFIGRDHMKLVWKNDNTYHFKQVSGESLEGSIAGAWKMRRKEAFVDDALRSVTTITNEHVFDFKEDGMLDVSVDGQYLYSGRYFFIGDVMIIEYGGLVEVPYVVDYVDVRKLQLRQCEWANEIPPHHTTTRITFTPASFQ